MKRLGCIYLILFFLPIACSTNQELRKRQAQDKRNIAAAYMSQQNYTEALRELLNAEKLYADDPDTQNDLGLVFMQKEEFDLAVKHFKNALELKPNYPSAKNNLGVAYLKQENWDAAITCFQELTKDLLYVTPQNPLVNMGFAYYSKGEYVQSEIYYNKALKFYKEGLAKDPTYIKCLYGLSRTYMATGRVLEAAALLEEAIKSAPRAYPLYFDLAEAYSATQDYGKAYRAYKKVVELAPDSDLALKAKKAAEKIENLRK